MTLINNILLFSVALCIQITGAQPPPAPSSPHQYPTQKERKQLCATIVTSLVPQLMFDVAADKLRRVELRTCAAGGDIQIVAWQDKATEPTLVVDTERVTVVQLVMAKNVMLIQTAGGTADRIQVILYEDGVPRIAFDRFSKSEPVIKVTWKHLNLALPDASGKLDQRAFSTGRQ